MQSVAVAHFCAIVYKWNIDEPEKKNIHPLEK